MEYRTKEILEPEVQNEDQTDHQTFETLLFDPFPLLFLLSLRILMVDTNRLGQLGCLGHGLSVMIPEFLNVRLNR